MEILIVLAVNCITGFGGYSVAKSKNREPALWAVACLLFGVIPLIILACLPAVVDLDKQCEDAIKAMKL